MPFKERLAKAYKAFSVQAIVALGASPVWYPMIEAGARAALGDKAQLYITAAIAIAGIFGFSVPQRSFGDK